MKIIGMKRGVTVCLCLAVALVLPLINDSLFFRNLLVLILIWSILGMGWNVIGGYAGQVSNGHSMFYAMGAYSTGLTLQYFNMPPLVSIPFGMLLAAAFAWVIGKPVLRLRGHAFAICTMALAECARYICVNVEFTNGATGVYLFTKGVNPWVYLQFTDVKIYYYLYLAVAAVVLLVTWRLSKRKFFYCLRTIKGNEEAAASVGIDVARCKVWAFMLSAAIVSLGGSLYAQYMLYFDPAGMMTLNVSMMIVLVSVMGGIGTVMGPVIGAVILQTMAEYTRAFLGNYGGLDMVLYGVLVIIIVLFLPEGIISLPGKLKAAFGSRPQNGKEAE